MAEQHITQDQAATKIQAQWRGREARMKTQRKLAKQRELAKKDAKAAWAKPPIR
eukprot:gene42555-22608_t